MSCHNLIINQSQYEASYTEKHKSDTLSRTFFSNLHCQKIKLIKLVKISHFSCFFGTYRPELSIYIFHSGKEHYDTVLYTQMSTSFSFMNIKLLLSGYMSHFSVLMLKATPNFFFHFLLSIGLFEISKLVACLIFPKNTHPQALFFCLQFSRD